MPDSRRMPFPREQSSEFYALTHYAGPLERFADMQKRYEPVAGFRFFGETLIAVLDPELAEQILVTQHALFVKDKFSQELITLLGQGLLTVEGEQHRRQRKLIAPTLTPAEVRQYVPAMFQCATTHAEKLHAGQHLDVKSLCMQVTLDVLSNILFGQTFDEVALVEQSLEKAMSAFLPRKAALRQALPSWFPLPSRHLLPQARQTLLGVAARIVEKKRQSGGSNDLLSRLIDASVDGERFSEEELADQVLTLLLAGHETTALQLTYALWLLAQNPDCYAKVEHEIDEVLGKDTQTKNTPITAEQLLKLSYTQAALKEALRLYPPAWMVGRRPIADCTVGGYQFLTTDQILIPFFTIHHDPKFHADPERFMPERFLPGGDIYEKRTPRFAYSPFGGGPRACVGNHFAQFEALAIVAALLAKRRFQASSAQPLKSVSAVTLRPAGKAMMTVSPR